MPQERGVRVSGVMRLLFVLSLTGGTLSGCAGDEAPPEPQASEAVIVAGPPESQAPVSVIVDVPQIAGKSEAEVAQILGEPTERSTTKNDGNTYPDLFYRNGQVEIVYVDGKAEWISVMNLDHLPFSPEALPALGITDAGPPSQASRGSIVWDDHTYPAFRGMHLFPRQGDRLDHAYFQVTRRP